jgi:hypothetical protein
MIVTINSRLGKGKIDNRRDEFDEDQENNRTTDRRGMGMPRLHRLIL